MLPDIKFQQRHATSRNRQRISNVVHLVTLNLHPRRLARLVVSHRIGAGDFPAGPGSCQLAALDGQGKFQSLHGRVDDTDGEGFAIGRQCGRQVQRRFGPDFQWK